MTFTTSHALLTSDRGITSSEANHVANLAKERVADGDRLLSTMTTLERTLHLTTEQVKLTDRNYNAATVQQVIDTRSRLYPLVAVFRAAIKARQKLLADIESAVPGGEFDIELPPRPDILPEPKRGHINLEMAPVTDGWGLDQLPYKQRVDMLACEARAAAYGAYIHNKGHLARLNEELAEQRATKTPEGLITVKYPSENIVTEQFEAVQSLHREAEQRLNMYRSKIHDLVNAENQRIQEANLRVRIEAEKVEMEHQHAIQRVALENDRIQTAWKLECQKLEAAAKAKYDQSVTQFEIERKQARITVAALKIQVPNDLQPVFDELKGN